MIHKTRSLHQGQKKVECFISLPSSLPRLPLCYSHLPVSETPPSRAQHQLSTWEMGSIFLESFVLNVLGVCPDWCDKQTNCWLKNKNLVQELVPKCLHSLENQINPVVVCGCVWVCLILLQVQMVAKAIQWLRVFPISQNGTVCNQNMEETIIFAMSNFVIFFFQLRNVAAC